MLQHINFSNVLTIAQAEKRLTRRLKRYWFFVLAGFAAATAIFVQYNLLHAFFSSFSATMGSINPRYLLSVPGLVMQGVFTLGVVFIAFDVRARDVRERIVEVLDCRPVSNLELVLGRFLALFQLAWFPVVFACLWLQFLGWFLPKIGAPVGIMIEPVSVLAFLTFVTIPSFCFTIALVFFVTLLVRNRVVSVLVTFAVIVGLFLGLARLPISTYPFWDQFGFTIATPFPTDLLTRFGTVEGWLQRGGFFVMACALLGLAAALHPRLDDSNRKRTALVSVVILAGGISLLVASSLKLSGFTVPPEWVATHEAATAEALPDIVRMDADVDVDPGRALDVALQLEFQAPADRQLDTAVFSLNPGFTLATVNVDGQAAQFTHDNGLLRITLPRALGAGTHAKLELVYSGKPNMQFAYLDSRLKFESLQDFSDRGLQGTEPGLFFAEYVALMPGTYWLPLAGPDVGRDDTRMRPRDFFNVAIDVEVPADWLVAGPGRRMDTAAKSGGARFRFAPDVQLSDVALVASDFTSFAADVHGIHFEFLMHHTRNFDVLAPLRAEIEAWVENRLQLAEDAGLVYPFDAFTIAEVPNGLRVYEGGWRMDTALAPPAMMLMSESGFPTARFDFTIETLGGNIASGATDGDQGMRYDDDSFKLIPFERLLNFFSSDLSGGNLFNAFSRSYVVHRTAATGIEAPALDFIVDMLATLVVSDERYYFSMYNDIETTVTNVINTVLQGGAVGDSLTQRTIDSFSDNVEVWNSALGQALATIDTTREPEDTINLLTLKGGELAQAIYDVLGPLRAGELLATLANRHAGAAYTLADFETALASFDANLAMLFDESFRSAELPGFVAQRAEVFRLPDGPSGEQRYQLLVAVRNDEPVAGFTRIAWLIDRGTEDDAIDFFASEPLRIDGHSAIEFGTVLTTPPASALVRPYLSLNRAQFTAAIFERDAIRRIDAEPFEGVRAIDWDDSSERIVADDLDFSFVVVDNNGTSSWDRTQADGDVDIPLDQGIRINQGNAPEDWNRIPSPTAFGKYRHTFVSILAGEGDKTATLTSTIPGAGLWDLEIHIPSASDFRTNNMKGTWNMTITSDYGSETIAFDNRAAIAGWNLIGSFELPRGDVKVTLTNKTDALTVLIDAIAWTPRNTSNEAAQ